MIRPTAILALALLSLAASSCAGPHWNKEREVVRTTGLRVELERWTGEGGTPIALAHPAQVDRAQLRDLLGALHEDAKGLLESSTLAVVAPERVDPLVDALTDALAAAEPNDRVRFAFENPTRAFGLFPALRLTRGVAFVDTSNELHLVFDLVNSQGDEDLGQWGDPTRRKISRTLLVLPSTARRYVDADGQQRDLWVVQPLRAAAPSGPAKPAPTETAKAPPANAEPARANVESEPAGVDAATRRRIQLEFLEELRREGLLGERAYQDKRAELESGSH